MSYTTKLGIISYAQDTIDVLSDELPTHKAWFDGFASGMHEADKINAEEYNEVLEAIACIGVTEEEEDFMIDLSTYEVPPTVFINGKMYVKGKGEVDVKKYEE